MGEGLFYSRRINIVEPVILTDVVYIQNTAADIVPWQSFGNWNTFQLSLKNVQSVINNSGLFPIFHGRDQHTWGGDMRMYITSNFDLILYRLRWEEPDEEMIICPASEFNFNTDDWINISVVFDGNNNILTYINDELKYTYTPTTVTLNHMRLDMFRFANSTGPGALYGLAAFSELRFWSVPLTAAQISDNWNRRICPPEYNDMVIYMPFDSLSDVNRINDVLSDGAYYLHLFGSLGNNFYVETDEDIKLTPC